MTQHNTTARATRRADGQFTTIANAALRDPRLSWKAKGILAGALSHGPGFRFNREWFVLNGTDGGAAVRSAFQELRDHGYLITERIVGPDGKFKGGSLHFSDDPSLLPQEEIHEADNRVVDFPPGGEPATIRRSIDRRPTEENQNSQEPPLPPAGGTHASGHGTVLSPFPGVGGTLAEDPHPQRTDPAPSPPKLTRMAKPSAFVPSPEDIPASLLPVEAPLRAFWQVKAGQTTQQAWNCLTGALERIWRHPDGGTGAVRDQLEAATQAGWRSITFANWQKYSQQVRPSSIHVRPAAGPRKSATDQAADNVLAMFAARGIG